MNVFTFTPSDLQSQDTIFLKICQNDASILVNSEKKSNIFQ